ncbi:MAG: 4-hydroxyphenylacetate 3-monooxygenase, oxygenase component [Candidatus Dormibacteraeota bacterium]|uniref:4-hydroxyphenylacetate 3-monooxygenase, oxygenase component n=1 Tax=Candidatus Dormiibacter inghamiae TaxID=3127013 RepID=A0A934KKP6_9BACT|nr:4-hydroxyphenylacetate 3-monooxygenase, oxygenase component [Candidatus Dormibacteraeota bacterium]MBJ7606216.1 4-hydroxyphenylacetate 3-monooxygenase, oxygenase component [Candidatus Dormibacteraeota bacterium]
MSARTGAQYLEALNSSRRDIRVHGETVRSDIASHPAFKGVAHAYAALYDLQHDERVKDVLTYPSPTTGEPVGTSFLQPRTKADLAQRSEMMKLWSDRSLGLLGRTGDYLNSSVMALAAAQDWFAQVDSGFGKNMRSYYEHVRDNDLLMTHTLINPQANRSQSAGAQRDPYQAAQILKETDSGIVIRGARMLATIGPIADEIVVFPSTVLQARPEDEPYSFAFAVSCDTPGLRFLCRESLDYGRSHFDHPLGSRFDEMDAVAIFDDVQVPYERCFMIRHPEVLTRGKMYSETGALAHMTHQVVLKDLAKTEFMLGLISLICDAIQIESFQHVQEKIAEVINTRELLRAVLRAAEADAEVNQWGLMTPAWAPLNTARNWFPRTYPRLREIVWQLAASGLFGLPTEADTKGETGVDVDRFLQAASLNGIDRVKLFRLAWDASASSFASRQEIYEFFFFGDPVRMAQALVGSYDRTEVKERVNAFLNSDGPLAPLAGPELLAAATGVRQGG